MSWEAYPCPPLPRPRDEGWGGHRQAPRTSTCPRLTDGWSPGPSQFHFCPQAISHSSPVALAPAHWPPLCAEQTLSGLALPPLAWNDCRGGVACSWALLLQSGRLQRPQQPSSAL